MSSIVFTPGGTLRFQDGAEPWQSSLFNLASQKRRAYDALEEFWRGFAVECLTSISHAANPDSPAPSEGEAVAAITPDDLSRFLDRAPFMKGGEYLNQERLSRLWQSFMGWAGEKIRLAGGIAPFLAEAAPQYNEVGRIFFHLGENRLDEKKPFAFLATFTTGLNENGRLRHTPLARALKLYSESRPDLLRLLGPVSRAAEALEWVRKLWDSGAIYKAMAWTPSQAHLFLQTARQLEQCGIGVRLPDWWKKRPRARVKATLNLREGVKLGLHSLLDCDLELALGDESLDESEIERLLESGQNGLVLIKNQWVEADNDKLAAALAHWRGVQKLAKAGELTFIQGMRLLAGIDGQDAEADQLEEMRDWSLVQAGKRLKEMVEHSRERDGEDRIPGLHAELRPYQREGARWLQFMGNLGLGACLADDMGLGKTIQVLSLLLLEKRETPALLVAPASLIANWEKESARFAPDLRVFTLHPSRLANEDMDSETVRGKLAGSDLVITTYGLCSRLKWLFEVEWSRIILDEAQNIKNRNTKQSQSIRKLRGQNRIALTGTPIENSLLDLWTLFDFINPGLLSSADQFTRLVKKLQKSETGLLPLRKLAAPYILRRMKTDKEIEASLPEKTEVRLCCNLTSRQASLYKKIVDGMARQMEKLAAADAPPKARNMLVLQNLTRLKQICNHPAQAGMVEEGEYNPASSGKFLRVGELCAEIAAKQEKVLIFTQFREIIKPLSVYLEKVFGESGLVLHGNTPMKARGSLVERFQREDGPPFFILSLKAGGSGLTLTQASHVIHFDRWWNPAVENQATDRAFRIGQKNNVLVHKCVTLGTVEEKIDDLIESKRNLASDMLDNIDSNLLAMTDAQILDLVKLDAGSLIGRD